MISASTNLIENPSRNARRKMERVCRWNAATDQASRWLAYALAEAQHGFLRVRHAEDLKALRAALGKRLSEGPCAPGRVAV